MVWNLEASGGKKGNILNKRNRKNKKKNRCNCALFFEKCTWTGLIQVSPPCLGCQGRGIGDNTPGGFF